MLVVKRYFFHTICLLLISLTGFSQQSKKTIDLIEQTFLHPPESAKPWVFWYWMHGAISKEGITADLEAMKEVGIGGAYLMPIQDTLSSIPFQPTVRQLTPEWWAMVKFAMQEAKRLNLKLAMHVSDGFALAGGPWITPELSMQKLVWTKTYIKDGDKGKINLEQPESYKDFYKDVAVFAYPANSSNAFDDEVLIPTVTASNGTRPQFLSFADPDNKESFKSDTACWIQYKYPKEFTCRSIRIHTGTNSYQAQRLIIQTSDDGINFKTITRLEPPRHGWQDTDEDYTHSIPATTSRYFRFVYDKNGSEPGSEDLDAAKWKPSLKVMGIYLSDEPMINQYETKNGGIWRVATNTTTQQVSDKNAIPLKSIINLTNKLDDEGNLNWTPPKGNWVVVRIGHTSTGQTNATGGAAKGLECDKFSATAIKLQFDNWFGRVFEKIDSALAKEVLKIFHVDSWECGSQNWNSNFANEFRKRRGYDLMPYLLVMTGVPIESAARSENVLHGVRTTIAELVNDIFYVTLKKLSAAIGCQFSAESIAPTFVSDGLLHYKNVDLPMGEFWLNSPTHDKPNDMLDAISGAHIYGKNIIQAESFTTLRMDWSEHPGNLKAIGDRNFALGINKMVLHVFAHNPWLDKKPGMTLDGVGLYFQRDQTWFKQSKAWIGYLTRCQALLQLGKPVVDVAVFTGEEVPRRSILPDRLVNTLPGIFGSERVESEKKRLENNGQPLRQKPDGVTHSANMADPENWMDPLNGYKYDCFNPDVLMQMKVVNGRVVTQDGASYAILVIPGKHPMNPNGTISAAVLNKLKRLANAGAKIIIGEDFIKSFNDNKNVVAAPYYEDSFDRLGVKRDIEFTDSSHSIAWTHRTSGNADIYFLSNQHDQSVEFRINFRVKEKDVRGFDAVTGKEIYPFIWPDTVGMWGELTLEANQSVFIIFSGKFIENKMIPFLPPGSIEISMHNKSWIITPYSKSNEKAKPVYTQELKSLTILPDSSLKYYSGTVVYKNSFDWRDEMKGKKLWIYLDSIYDIATIKINGIDCGTLWTRPYELDITKTIKRGKNTIEIEVTNTWHNRLIGDALLPPEKRITWTTAPFRLKYKPLLPAGLVGEVRILIH
jgi:hypothetical protein